MTTQAYADVASTSSLAPLVERLSSAPSEEHGALAERIRARLLEVEIPITLREEIAQAYAELGEAAVAVRSSATAEDLPTASFAGQQDTYLNVTSYESLLDAIRRCWGSLWSDRAVEYRANERIDHREVRIAVVVQQMVFAKVAGVLFTANPVTGARGQTVIEATYGLGESVVGGSVRPDHFVVQSGEIIERRLGDKASAVSADPDGETTHVDLPDSHDQASLDDAKILELAAIGARVEECFGAPQDVEFAFDPDNGLWLLQARPITALPADTPTASREEREFSVSQLRAVFGILERFPVAFHPLDYSLFVRPLLARMLPGLGYLGFVPIDSEDVILETADGVYQLMPPDLRRTYRSHALPLKILMAARRSDYRRWVDECREKLVALTDATENADLAEFSDVALLERMEQVSNRALDLFPSRFANVSAGIVAERLFDRILGWGVGSQAPEMRAELLAGVESISTRANDEIRTIARRIRASSFLLPLFRDESAEALISRLDQSSEGRALRSEIDRYLKTYGLRETTMASVAHPSWREHPRFVLGLLKGMIATDGEDQSGEKHEPSRESRLADVETTIARRWLGLGRYFVLPLFRRALEGSRRFIAFREDSHYYLLTPSAVNRRLALELARRLVGASLLESPDDIFFLHLEEIRDVLRNPRSSEAATLVRNRRKARGREGRFASVPDDLLAAMHEAIAAEAEIRGEPASAGEAAGVVRIIRGVQDFSKLQEGEILVAPYTNPTWTPLFQSAAGIIVDTGGMGSHAAIVARERRIPAVMGVGNATKILRDGQRVLVDGNQGLVVLLDADRD